VTLPDLELGLVQLFDAPEALLLALLVAFGVGAFHALAPGHGKAIAAAYLVAQRARYRDAAVLGAVVAAMHTVSVAVLAGAWVGLAATATVSTEAVTSWLQVATAAAVVAVGVHLLRAQLRRDGRAHDDGEHDHDHGHGGHDGHTHGGHGHLDDEAHARAHADAVVALLHAAADDETTASQGGVTTAPRGGMTPPRPRSSRRVLLAIAAAGGLLPSPSAFLVLVGGLLTGRLGLALLLVFAFAVGMAGTLTAIGALTVAGRDALARTRDRASLAGRLHRVAPMVGAAGVLAAGGIYLVLAARQVLGG